MRATRTNGRTNTIRNAATNRFPMPITSITSSADTCTIGTATIATITGDWIAPSALAQAISA